jgi:hypothetical protein
MRVALFRRVLAWPWKTCPLHNIETPYDMHTHEVAITNLRRDTLLEFLDFAIVICN